MSTSARQPEDPEDEDDDYMTMTFGEATTQPESSLQRRQRQQREGRERGHTKSKAQLAEEEAAKREEGLATSLLADPQAAKKSKGLAMMARMGFTGGKLGAADNSEHASAEPIRIAVKEDRGGIGADAERKRKVAEVAAEMEGRVKRARAEEGDYRERVRREREDARTERQVVGAQKIAERMEEEKGATPGGDGKKARSISARPLKSVNVLWRGVVRAREEKERDRRMRHDLEQSLSRLPNYEDELEDADDKMAMGKTNTVYVTADDLDEEDPELDDFNALDVDEKLRRVVEFLRKEYFYCFWCKFTYPDAQMEGCPGVTEEDHD